MKPWWERNTAPSYIAHRTPAAWRDITDLLRILYYHLALRELGDVQGFSLNLDSEIETKARLNPSPLEWLRRRVAHHLKQAFGRLVPFYLVLEETSDRRLHLHGEIGIPADAASAGRRALRKAGGEWKHTRQHQAHTRCSPDVVWASYVSKNTWLASPGMRSFFERYDARQPVSFKGGVVTCTADVKTVAKLLHAREREQMMNAGFCRRSPLETAPAGSRSVSLRTHKGTGTAPMSARASECAAGNGASVNPERCCVVPEVAKIPAVPLLNREVQIEELDLSPVSAKCHVDHAGDAEVIEPSPDIPNEENSIEEPVHAGLEEPQPARTSKASASSEGVLKNEKSSLLVPIAVNGTSEFTFDPNESRLAERSRVRAGRIRKHVESGNVAYLKVGRELLEAKADLGHGKFLPWVRSEFGWSERTVQNFMNAASAASRYPQFESLPRTAQALLGMKNTPESVREAIRHRLDQGERIKLDEVKAIVAASKGKPTDAPTTPKAAKESDAIETAMDLPAKSERSSNSTSISSSASRSTRDANAEKLASVIERMAGSKLELLVATMKRLDMAESPF